MKKVSIILSVILLIGLFTGCSSTNGNSDNSSSTGSNVTTDEIWNNIEKTINPSGDALPSFMDNVTVDILGQLYGLVSDDVEQFTLKTPMMNVQATEIFIAKVKPGRMDAVKEAVAKRQKALDETWNRYLPDQYELVTNYKTAEKGDYIIFVVAEKADEIIKVFEDSIQ